MPQPSVAVHLVEHQTAVHARVDVNHVRVQHYISRTEFCLHRLQHTLWPTLRPNCCINRLNHFYEVRYVQSLGVI